MAAVHHFARSMNCFDFAAYFKRGLNIVRSGHAKGQPNGGVIHAPNVILEHFDLPGHIHNSNKYDDINVVDSHRECIDGYDTITLGGDHMVAYDSVSYQLTQVPSKKFGLIWIDAHADINTFTTSVTKNKHGMVVSNLLGLDDSVRGPYDIHNNLLRPGNIVYIGLRSVDPPEREIMNELGIKAVSSEFINLGGGTIFIKHALDWILRDCDHIHVSFDVDVMDPHIFPATGTPVPDGINDYRKVSEITSILYNDLRVRSMDLVEYDPTMDDVEYSCGLLATDILTSSFTNTYSF